MVDEPEPRPYCLAARFNTEHRAERAYFRLQEYVRTHPDQLDLSVYRFLLRGVSVVAVVGDDPGQEVGKRIERELSPGRRTTLEDDVLQFLLERREQGRTGQRTLQLKRRRTSKFLRNTTLGGSFPI